MENSPKLEDLRKTWEGDDPSIVVEKEHKTGPIFKCLCVVIPASVEKFRCLRYFKTHNEDEWGVSVDGDFVTAKTALRWVVNPSAEICQEAELC